MGNRLSPFSKAELEKERRSSMAQAEKKRKTEVGTITRHKKFFYDQYGILREGVVSQDGQIHNRDDELKRILLADREQFIEGYEKPWTEDEKADGMHRRMYIIESGWIRHWTSYVQYGSTTLHAVATPSPGPINNERLLMMWADESKKHRFLWKPKSQLVCANKETQGHYRAVNYRVWEEFCDMYPGSGPTIYVDPPDEEEDDEGVGEAAEEGTSGLEEKTEDKGLFSWTLGTDNDAGVPNGPGEAGEEELNPWEQLDKWEIDQDQSRFMRKFEDLAKRTEVNSSKEDIMDKAWEVYKEPKEDSLAKGDDPTVSAASTDDTSPTSTTTNVSEDLRGLEEIPEEEGEEEKEHIDGKAEHRVSRVNRGVSLQPPLDEVFRDSRDGLRLFRDSDGGGSGTIVMTANPAAQVKRPSGAPGP